MGIDDESSHPELCSEVADGVTRNIVCLFREPDAGNPPVRFDEREQETEPGQTGLRWARRKPRPIATGRLKPLRLFSTLLIGPSEGVLSVMAWFRQLTKQLLESLAIFAVSVDGLDSERFNGAHVSIPDS